MINAGEVNLGDAYNGTVRGIGPKVNRQTRLQPDGQVGGS